MGLFSILGLCDFKFIFEGVDDRAFTVDVNKLIDQAKGLVNMTDYDYFIERFTFIIMSSLLMFCIMKEQPIFFESISTKDSIWGYININEKQDRIFFSVKFCVNLKVIDTKIFGKQKLLVAL